MTEALHTASPVKPVPECAASQDTSRTSPRNERSQRFRQGLFLVAVPLALLALCWWNQPFGDTLLSRTMSTATLNAAQVTNLRVAARHLDDYVLQPGDTFSFNRVVGPRTEGRGYRTAPSYLGGESPSTMGGGICLLSSAVYRLALEAGFPIERRVPHLRTIHSVPPGLDATVWYGGADLKFRNSLSKPVRIMAKVQAGQLVLGLQGTGQFRAQSVYRRVRRLNPTQVQVTVLRGGQPVSHDLYRLSP